MLKVVLGLALMAILAPLCSPADAAGAATKPQRGHRRWNHAANATSRAARGQTKRATKDVFYRTRRRGQSYALREELEGIARELSRTKTISDPARAQLLKTRKAVIAGWNAVAANLEAQGEIARLTLARVGLRARGETDSAGSRLLPRAPEAWRP